MRLVYVTAADRCHELQVNTNVAQATLTFLITDVSGGELGASTNPALAPDLGRSRPEKTATDTTAAAATAPTRRRRWYRQLHLAPVLHDFRAPEHGQRHTEPRRCCSFRYGRKCWPIRAICRRRRARLWRRPPFVGLIHSTAAGWRPSACSRTMRLDGLTLLLLLLHLLLPLPPDRSHVIGRSRVRPRSLASGVFAFRGEGALIWAGPVVLLSSASCAFLERRPASLLLQVDQAVSPLVGYSPLVEGGAPNAQTARPPVRHYGDMTCRASHCAMHVTCSL